MAIETKPTRIAEPGDPRRCQNVHRGGQCLYISIEGSNMCELHVNPAATRNKMTRLYNVAKWNAKIEGFAEHEGVKGLREETGILRMLLESVLNRCQDDYDLLLYSSKISDLVSRIESIVRSCHKLESSMGQLLDKAAALQLSGEIVEIIGTHVHDENIVDIIAKEIAAALVRIEQRSVPDGIGQ